MPGATSRMADRPQVNRVELPQFVDCPGRQRFAGAQIALAAEIEMQSVSYWNFSSLSTAVQDFEPFGGHFRAGAVAADHGDAQFAVGGSFLGVAHADGP